MVGCRRRSMVAAVGSAPRDAQDVDGRRRVAAGRLVDHDLAALTQASRLLAVELVTRAGLGEFSELARQLVAPAGGEVCGDSAGIARIAGSQGRLDGHRE